MSSLPIVSFERMPPAELLGLVRNLIAEVGRLRAENEKLSEALAMQRVENQALKDEIARLKHLPPRPPLKPSGMDKATDRPEVWAEGKKGKAEVGRLRAENEKLSEALAMQRVENQALKDEIARLKHLPPRPPLKPSGMDKATDRPEVWAEGKKGKASKRRRGPGVSKLSIDRTVTLTVKPAAGARHKGYEEIVVQDLMLRAETTLYRRERWRTPDGDTLTAPLDTGIVGGCGPHLHRLVLMLHFQGQMPCERIVELLAGLGLAISKRQVVRLLIAKLDRFRAEDAAVLRAGLIGAPFVTVDDTGARH